jgi:UDP-N-acetylmuramate--alanine ligase
MKKIHFIGIGGIGVSALARYYLEKGHKITGSDLVFSEITQDLEKKGVEIFIGKHKGINIKEDIDLVIYTSAANDSNPEVKKAKELNIKIQSYSQALGDLTKEYFTIAVSGTHGKSSTSSMLGLLLIKAGLDPTVIIGTKLRELGDSNCRVGNSKYLVIEADEWNASFLNYYPDILVLTNIEIEHLDFYKDLDDILFTYKKYLNNLSKESFLIINGNDKNIGKLMESIKPCPFNVKSFSLDQNEADEIKNVMKIPGKHNIANALAVLSVAEILNIDKKTVLESLSEYKGSWRRFDLSQRRTKDAKFTLINDYAHHPTEIKATLNACKEKFPDRKIYAVFQPHQYQRTFYLFDDFIKVLSNSLIDELIIADIYDVAGREEATIKKNVSSEKLVKEIEKKANFKTFYIPTINKIARHLNKKLEEKDVLIIMGAGTIYELASYFPLDRKQTNKENKLIDL